MSEGIPYETLSAELLQAVRGRHAQILLSRRLGYDSNIIYRWETQKCWPTAAMFLQLCKRVRIDVAGSFRKFYGRQPDWLVEGDPCSEQTVVAFLKDLQGTVPIQALARAVGQSRFTVSRWLNGTAQPRLPDFLRVLEATSRRTLDFVSTFTDPQDLPCVTKTWRRLQRAKQVAYDSPWSHAVLHALELEELSHPKVRLGVLANRLGISEVEVTTALHALQEAGQVRRHRGSWRITRQQTVNTAQDPERALQLKAFWFQVATDRVRAHAPGFFGYSLFAISEQDMRRLREVQLEYIRQMQAIIAGSAPGERVGLYSVQLLDLAKGADNTFAPGRNTGRRPSKSATTRRK